MSGVIWSKWFWDDWKGDPALRLCSFGARGLWIDMLCIAARHDPIGYVAVAGHGLDIPGLSKILGGDASEIAALLGELERNGVFSRDRKGRIYSRRMIRDAKKAAIARANGKKAVPEKHGTSHGNDRGNPASVHPYSLGAISQTSETPPKKTHIRAVAAATRPGVRDGCFDDFWRAYPRRDGANPRNPARRKFASIVASGIDPAAIIAGTQRYAADIRAKHQERTRFVAQAVTWLDQRRWEDEPAADVPSAEETQRLFAQLRGGKC